MLFTIAVDANPILAALLGGYARTILFDPRFCFITAEFTIAEVRRYLSRVSLKSGVSIFELEKAISLMPLEVIESSTYRRELPEARRRIGHIDPDDADILALALHFDIPLWTNDKDFTKADRPIRLVRTGDFIL